MCGEESCQRERHRQACASWRRENAAEEKEERLRQRLQAPTDGGPRAAMAGLRLEAVRDAAGPEVAVIIEETGRVLGDWVRDAVGGQLFGMTRESGRHPGAGPQDGIATGRGPP